MAVLGRLRISSAERLDLPDFLSIDSYTQGDFKYLMKSFVGSDRPYVLKGFEVIDPGACIGTQNIAISVADSVVYYPQSSAGPFFYGLEEGNPKAAPLIPELRKNATNYVYLVLTTEDGAKDTRAFWDPDKEGGVGGEFTQDIDTETILRTDVNISVSSFPENVIPICKVVVGTNFIESIEDARDMMFRLGSGGISPNPLSRYQFREEPLAAYKRSEPNTLMSNALDPNSFKGGDKNIQTLKEWMDVVMTKLLELSGTTYWYEDSTSYSIVNIFKDALATSIRSKGTWENSGITPGLLTWTEDIIIQSMTDKKDIVIRAGNKTLGNEQIMFVKQERNLPINTGAVSVDWLNGLPYVNGVLGSFENLSKGDWIRKASDPDFRYYRVEEFYAAMNLGGGATFPANALSIKLSDNYSGLTETSQAIYSKGQFLSSEVQVVDRDDPALYAAGGDLCWLAVRSDRILSVSDAVATELLINITNHDGEKARCTSVAHGLSDKQRIYIDGTTNFDGEYQVEIESADVFYIQKTGGPFADELTKTAHYATITTVATSTVNGFQLESANHGFDVDDNVIVTGTSNYNNTYQVFPKTSTQFTFAISGMAAAETFTPINYAKAKTIEIYVRTDIGPTNLEQGESKQIGKVDSQNIMSFIGMDNSAMMKPVYSIDLGYNTLDGFANYNSSSSDNLTQRVSKLTAMMADKAQDKTVTYELDNVFTIVKAPNGFYQDIAVLGPSATIPKLTFIQPSTEYKVEITLTGTLSLLNNQAAYITMNRNDNTTVSSLASVIVVDTSELPLSENIFIIALRASTDSVILWDKTPIRDYEQIMGDLETETTKITFSNASSITSGQYFKINSSLDIKKYYVWFNKDGIGGDPLVIGRIGIEVPIITGDGPLSIATAANAAIGAATISYISSVDNFDGTITLTNSSAGYCTHAANFNVGGAFSISIEVAGSGSSLHYITNGDLLEAAIKKLDQKIYELSLTIPEQAYEEIVDITVTKLAGSTLILPLDSRNSNSVKGYTVGEGQLEIFLNGQYLTVGEDWAEVGLSGEESITVTTLQDLSVGDVVLFRIDNHSIGGGAGGAGSGEANTASNIGGGSGVFQSKVGVDLRFRSLTAGAGISLVQGPSTITVSSTPVAAALNVISITGSNYNALPSNDVILVYNAGVNVNIVLPSAALNLGKRFEIKKVDSGNLLRIKGQTGETLDGVDIFSSSWDVSVQYECITVVSNGLNWFII
jgi:hypothetical protein